jgi:hypothetical protein
VTDAGVKVRLSIRMTAGPLPAPVSQSLISVFWPNRTVREMGLGVVKGALA